MSEDPAKGETVLSPERWHDIKLIFMNSGFSKAEAEWAAEQNLDPHGPKREAILSLLRRRRLKVKALMKYTGAGRREIILELEESSKIVALEKGFDAMNIFAGASP